MTTVPRLITNILGEVAKLSCTTGSAARADILRKLEELLDEIDQMAICNPDIMITIIQHTKDEVDDVHRISQLQGWKTIEDESSIHLTDVFPDKAGQI